MINGKSILITGGTGSFGHKIVETLLKSYRPERLIVFSRDEYKQYEMQRKFSPSEHSCLRYFIGDIRDTERLYRAFAKIDIVIHTATLRDVPACEYNPYEAVKTNILGSQNIVEAAIDRGVSRVVSVSTEEAANPVNLFGATKLCSERLFISGNSYAGSRSTRFSVVRFGNVLGYQGDTVSKLLKAAQEGPVTIDDPEITRFWISLQQAVDFTLNSLESMQGGEIFIPKSPSMKLGDLVEVFCPDSEVVTEGPVPGENKHCVMIPANEAANTYEYDDHYLIQPTYRFFERGENKCCGKKVAPDFEYVSNKNDSWMSKEELRSLAGAIDKRD